MTGLIRIDAPGCRSYGWQTRLHRGKVGRHSVYDSKFFADKKHGGYRRARQLAGRWLEAQRLTQGNTHKGGKDMKRRKRVPNTRQDRLQQARAAVQPCR